MTALPDDDSCGMDLFELQPTLDGPIPKRLKFSPASTEKQILGIGQIMQCFVLHVGNSLCCPQKV